MNDYRWWLADHIAPHLINQHPKSAAEDTISMKLPHGNCPGKGLRLNAAYESHMSNGRWLSAMDVECSATASITWEIDVNASD